MSNIKIKKIAIFISSFRAGGGEINMINLANNFVDRGFKVDLLVMKPVGKCRDMIKSSVNIVNVDSGRIIFSIPRIISYLRKNRPNFIIATDEFSHIISLTSVKLSLVRTKTVFRVGNMFSILFSRYKGLKQGVIIPFIAKRIYRYADIFIANSFGVADDIENFFKISKKKINIIHNPKKIKKIIEMSKKDAGHNWVDEKDLPVILFAGRLREQKNIPILIRAFAETSSRIPSRLLLIGIGRERARLERLVKELNIDKFVDFFGFSENPYSFMSKVDIFATTSIWEGFSNSLQEAMICGAPVIATDCSSGPREMIAPDTDPLHRMNSGVEYGKYGILVPMNKVEEVSTAMENLLKNKEIKEKYSKLSSLRGESFNSNKIFDQYLEALNLK